MPVTANRPGLGRAELQHAELPLEDRNRPRPRLIAGQHSAGPEAHAAWASPCAVLHHEAFAPAGHYAHPEAGDAFIPDEELHQLRFRCVDSAFGKFRHG